MLGSLAHPRNLNKLKLTTGLFFILAGIFFMTTIIIAKNEKNDVESYLRESLKTSIVTARGLASYAEINELVFKPHGFRITKLSSPIPTLVKIAPQSCEEIFNEWLAIAIAYNAPKSAPKKIVEDLLANYTLNGYTIVSHEYYDNLAVPKPNIWSQVSDWIGQHPINFSAYGETSLSIMHSLHYMGVKGLTGCVIGSQTPWVEVIALQNGAKSLLTVEYQKTEIIDTRRIDYIHPIDYAKGYQEKKQQFDFAVSFSSIEHSGLQRYGDPMDPIGDIREVQKVRCMLKKGGLFFLGVPFGQDQIVYNAHRVYGPIRLAMMFEGFELVHTFRDNNPNPYPLSVNDFIPTDRPIHATFVLRKL